MDAKENILSLKNELKDYEFTLVAVSKTKPNQMIENVYNSGHRDFGENKVQELVPKYEELPKDIRWHFIGHLQRNKVKYIVPFVHLIHSVDSLKLLKEINKQSNKINRKVDCLLQIHIAREETKYGLDESELFELIESHLEDFSYVNVKGLMGMATFTDKEEVISNEFSYLKDLFEKVKSISKKNLDLKYLSMGMSNDYSIALENGSNMLRIGSTIFGERK